jgi:hypothetical protein
MATLQAIAQGLGVIEGDSGRAQLLMLYEPHADRPWHFEKKTVS